MKLWKRALAVFLAVLMMMPKGGGLLAMENDAAAEPAVVTDTWVNPLYADVQAQEDLVQLADVPQLLAEETPGNTNDEADEGEYL